MKERCTRHKRHEEEASGRCKRYKRHEGRYKGDITVIRDIKGGIREIRETQKREGDIRDMRDTLGKQMHV